MIANTIALASQAGIAMSVSGRVRVTAALPTSVDATPVCGYRHFGTDVATLKGVFPGTSAWSPPI